MRIAVKGYPIGFQATDYIHGVDQSIQALKRQAIYEVIINGCISDTTRLQSNRQYLFEGLLAVDDKLYFRIKVLNAQAQSPEAQIIQGLQMVNGGIGRERFKAEFRFSWICTPSSKPSINLCKLPALKNVGVPPPKCISRIMGKS